MSKSINISHLNPRGTGSALRLDLVPATEAADGHITATIAPQAGDAADMGQAVAACLSLAELSEVVQVLRGMCESIHDGRGITRTTPAGSVTVNLAHRIEPIAGYRLTIARHDETATAGAVVREITLTTSEALVVMLAVEGAITRIAFGD